MSMLTSFFVGLITGVLLCLPPGPLAVEVIKQGLNGQRSAGLQITVAAAIMDCLYALIAAFAASTVVAAVADLLTMHQWIVLGFQVLCVLGLVGLGIHYLRQRLHPAEATSMISRVERQEQRVRRLKISSPWLLGVLIALTNLALPAFMPSLIAVVSSLHVWGWLPHSVEAHIEFALGFGCGTGLWLLALLHFFSAHRTKLRGPVIAGIFRFAGVIFLFSAAVLVMHISFATEWTNLLAHLLRVLRNI